MFSSVSMLKALEEKIQYLHLFVDQTDLFSRLSIFNYEDIYCYQCYHSQGFLINKSKITHKYKTRYKRITTIFHINITLTYTYIYNIHHKNQQSPIKLLRLTLKIFFIPQINYCQKFPFIALLKVHLMHLWKIKILPRCSPNSLQPVEKQ